MLKNLFGHFSTIMKHKWMVFKLCCKAGIPIRGLLHDLSKFSPTEFFPGVKYYVGFKSPNGKAKEELGYSTAWLHHFGRNKHHHEYWYDYRAPNKTPMMPYKYIIEMICDDLAAGITYNGKNWKQSAQLDYWMNQIDKVKINPALNKMMVEVYTEVSKKGIKNVITKKNLKRLYDKHCKDYKWVKKNEK